MPEIIKHGKYPEKNKHTCEECGCEFKYWNSEIKVDMTTPDEEAFFGGFGCMKTIKCPECGHLICLSYNFTESESFIDKLCDIFKLKKKEKKEKNENENENEKKDSI